MVKDIKRITNPLLGIVYEEQQQKSGTKPYYGRHDNYQPNEYNERRNRINNDGARKYNFDNRNARFQ